jgi:hypothetical protein
MSDGLEKERFGPSPRNFALARLVGGTTIIDAPPQGAAGGWRLGDAGSLACADVLPPTSL